MAKNTEDGTAAIICADTEHGRNDNDPESLQIQREKCFLETGVKTCT